MTDEQLWDAYVGGDDAALEALVDRHNGALFWYLFLSTGRQQPAAQHVFRTWDLVARWRRPYEGFGSFRALALRRGDAEQRPGRPSRGTRPDGADGGHAPRRSLPAAGARCSSASPTCTATCASLSCWSASPGLTIAEAARACNFTEQDTARCVETAYRRLARARLFKSPKTAR